MSTTPIEVVARPVGVSRWPSRADSCYVAKAKSDRQGPQVLPVTAGIPWLGFVVYPTHRRVKRRNVVRYRRRLAGLLDRHRRGELSFEDFQAIIRGWVEHVRYADTWGLRRAVLGTVRLGPWGDRAAERDEDSALRLE